MADDTQVIAKTFTKVNVGKVQVEYTQPAQDITEVVDIADLQNKNDLNQKAIANLQAQIDALNQTISDNQALIDQATAQVPDLMQPMNVPADAQSVSPSPAVPSDPAQPDPATAN